MPDRYSTGPAARAIGVSDSTIRIWARSFAEYLGPAANPGHGAPRVFTREDLAVLSMIKDWRAADSSLTDDEIADRLRQVPPAEFAAGPSVDVDGGRVASAPASSSGSSPAAGQASAGAGGASAAAADEHGADLPATLPGPGDPGAVLAAFVERLGQVDQRLAAVEAQGTAQRLIAPWVIAGLVAGGLLGILIGLLIAGAR